MLRVVVLTEPAAALGGRGHAPAAKQAVAPRQWVAQGRVRQAASPLLTVMAGERQMVMQMREQPATATA